MFIEIIVSDPAIIASNIRAKAISEGCPAPTSEQIEGEMERMDEYARRYVTLQDDGSEDDLAYVKVGNYGRKVSLPTCLPPPLFRPSFSCPYPSHLSPTLLPSALSCSLFTLLSHLSRNPALFPLCPVNAPLYPSPLFLPSPLGPSISPRSPPLSHLACPLPSPR